MQSSLLRKASSPLLRSLTTTQFLSPPHWFFWSRSSKSNQTAISTSPSDPSQANPTPQQPQAIPQTPSSQTSTHATNIEATQAVSPPHYDMKYIDDMDIGGLGESISPVDLDNIVQGGSTLGFSEIFSYFDANIETLWLYLSMDLGLGMTGGLVSLALLIRTICLPIQVYSQVMGIKTSLLHPDIQDIRTRMNDYARNGNRDAQIAESNKLKKLNRKHGIYNLFSALNLLQLPVHLAFLSVINRYAFNFDQHPEITTGGILWFKDLSDPDPFGILPVSCGVLMWFTFLTQILSPNTPQWLRNTRKYLTVLPLLSIPIWTSLPAGFNLYWLITSISNLSLNLIIRSTFFRKKMGIYGYLPGTKLARLNQTTTEIIKPGKVFKNPPTKSKLNASLAH